MKDDDGRKCSIEHCKTVQRRLYTHLMNMMLTRAIELADVGGVNFFGGTWIGGGTNWHENCVVVGFLARVGMAVRTPSGLSALGIL
jgi:hypothetical protein